LILVRQHRFCGKDRGDLEVASALSQTNAGFLAAAAARKQGLNNVGRRGCS